jgi:tetratricopeptide (TPR) repeat protein
MPQRDDYKKWFNEALEIEDEFDLVQALEDLCFDAESFYEEGDKEKAKFLFKQLITLDEDNDLYYTCIETAREYLIKMKEIKLDSLDKIIEKLEKEYRNLSDYDKILAISKTLHREYYKRKGALKAALEYLEKAEKIKPLSKKDRHYKAELLQAIKED